MRFAIALVLLSVLLMVMPWRAGADGTGWNRVRLTAVVTLNLLLVCLLVVPWQRFDPSPYWERIRWIPLVSPPVVPRDLIGNVALYMPLGHAVARLAGVRQGVMMAVLAAATLACVTETLQLFSRSRYPSTTDILSNVTGAWLGALAARALARRARHGTRPR